MKRFLFPSIAVLFGIGLTLVLLELLLRLLPVPDALQTMPVSEQQPYAHFQPRRTVTYSIGWNFSTVVRKRSNNYGYFSANDFDSTMTSPLLVVIGDSYVEAAQVQSDESMHGLLARSVGSQGRVYGVGISGAPLSQYLAFANFAREEFRPDAMAVVIVGNDFDESLRKYSRKPGQHQFVRCAEGVAELKLYPMHEGPWFVRLAKRSALVRYVMSNLGLNRLIARVRYRGEGRGLTDVFVGNVTAEYTAERLADSTCAVEAFLRLLPQKSGLSPERILFVVDGMRSHLYTKAGMQRATGSYFGVMRERFLRRAAELGYEAIDMQPVFIKSYRASGRAFEFPNDGHWNELAHALVAGEIERSQTFRRAFSSSRVSTPVGSDAMPPRSH